jgi:ABC-2 type transport system ATP-binding protein
MRMIVGLDHPTSGTAQVEGRPYAEHAAPMRIVGAMLDGHALHPGRIGRRHLQSLAATHRIPSRRVDDFLTLVGLESVANRRASSYSVGMAQRLGIAAALLGDPGVLVLDEPVNGLDPAGIVWMRGLLRSLAAEGRTVFVSSHLVAEVANVADRVLIIGRGRVLADQSLDELTASTLPTLERTNQRHQPRHERARYLHAEALAGVPGAQFYSEIASAKPLTAPIARAEANGKCPQVGGQRGSRRSASGAGG